HTGRTGHTGHTGNHDALLRRLRELGELHRAGVLTDEEFSTAKQAVLRSM
ncbi:SHOCT domain-containing protein, partial [Streptomyces sp. B226SN101]